MFRNKIEEKRSKELNGENVLEPYDGDSGKSVSSIRSDSEEEGYIVVYPRKKESPTTV